jgi:hypothetical protein
MGTQENRRRALRRAEHARRSGLILLLLLLIAAVGFYSKLYAGPGASWVNNSLGGVIYEIFWCLAVMLFLPRTRTGRIAAWVLVVTCTLEVLQLWRQPHLEAVRATFLGRSLLGTSFTWLDFPYYVVGCGIGWLLMRTLQSYFRRTAVP